MKMIMAFVRPEMVEIGFVDTRKGWFYSLHQG